SFLEVLRQARAAEDAQRNVWRRDLDVRVGEDLAKDEPTTREMRGIDLLDETLQLARDDLSRKTRRYRDGLDALKVELGLSPEAPVVPDRAPLGAFGAVFVSIQ